MCGARLELVAKRLGKQKWIHELVEIAKAVVKFFRQKHMLLSIFRKYEM